MNKDSIWYPSAMMSVWERYTDFRDRIYFYDKFCQDNPFKELVDIQDGLVFILIVLLSPLLLWYYLLEVMDNTFDWVCIKLFVEWPLKGMRQY